MDQPARDERRPREGELFRLMVENVRDYAIFSLDAAGKVSTWNPGAQRMFGYAESEILGQDGAILFTPEDSKAGGPQREMQQARDARRDEEQRRNVCKHGSSFFISGVLTPIRNSELHGYTKIAHDVTAQKAAAEEAARLYERRRESESRYRQLADNLP